MVFIEFKSAVELLRTLCDNPPIDPAERAQALKLAAGMHSRMNRIDDYGADSTKHHLRAVKQRFDLDPTDEAFEEMAAAELGKTALQESCLVLRRSAKYAAAQYFGTQCLPFLRAHLSRLVEMAAKVRDELQTPEVQLSRKLGVDYVESGNITAINSAIVSVVTRSTALGQDHIRGDRVVFEVLYGISIADS